MAEQETVLVRERERVRKGEREVNIENQKTQKV